MPIATPTKLSAIFGLTFGAFVWGIIWYPYRLLDAAGIGGALSSLLTYSVPLVLGAVLYRKRLTGIRSHPRLVLVIAVVAGWTNLGYVLAMLDGQVMRVLLLFYLAPLWTVVFSRWLLKERLTGRGVSIMALSLAGAAVMLWRPELGVPLPANRAEWIGLTAGMMFALSNVLSRYAHALSVEAKSMAIWFGVVMLSGVPLLVDVDGLPLLPALSLYSWGLIVLIGLALFFVTLAVQYGLARLPANQAIIILLSELVFAAVTAYFLAHESMTVREWIGGGMIVAASLFSGHLDKHNNEH